MPLALNDLKGRDSGQVSLALHEAAHAVVAIQTGISVRYATVAARSGGGRVVLRNRRSGWPWMGTLATFAAGAIVEDVADRANRYAIADDSADDIEAIRAIARQWCRERSDAATVLDLVTRAWATAFNLVIEHYGAILAVAEQLLVDRSAVTGVQVRQHVATAGQVRPESIHDDAHTLWITRYSHLRKWK